MVVFNICSYRTTNGHESDRRRLGFNIVSVIYSYRTTDSHGNRLMVGTAS